MSCWPDDPHHPDDPHQTHAISHESYSCNYLVSPDDKHPFPWKRIFDRRCNYLSKPDNKHPEEVGGSMEPVVTTLQILMTNTSRRCGGIHGYRCKYTQNPDDKHHKQWQKLPPLVGTTLILMTIWGCIICNPKHI